MSDSDTTRSSSATIWERVAQAAAAQGSQFIIGVRAHNGSWYAHCDGHEVDSSGPEQAAEDLIQRLQSFARKAAREAAREEERARIRSSLLDSVSGSRPEGGAT